MRIPDLPGRHTEPDHTAHRYPGPCHANRSDAAHRERTSVAPVTPNWAVSEITGSATPTLRDLNGAAQRLGRRRASHRRSQADRPLVAARIPRVPDGLLFLGTATVEVPQAFQRIRQQMIS